MNGKYIAWFLVSWICLNSVYGQRFVAFANKNEVGIGDVFQISFRLEDAKSQDIDYPSFEDFDVVGGPNTSQSMQIINGQVSQSMTYSFYLRAQTLGEFTIGQASANVDGEQFTTDPIKIKVVQSSSNSSSQNPSQGEADEPRASADLMQEISENVFVRAIPSKTRVYQGEQFNVTYKLYRRASLADLSLSGSPAYKNFWVEDISIDQPQSREEAYKGVNYSTAVIKKVILFPQRSGNLSVDPIELEAQVRVRVQSRRRRSVFDDFFDDPFFGSFRDVPYSFASSSIPIDVKPLPTANKPASFTGMVGDFTLDASLDKESTETGEPITLRIVISGKGNIKSIPEPQLDFPPDFEVYDPKSTDNTSLVGGVASGSKTFDYLIIPRNPGEYKLPVVTFSYFDPDKARYESLKSDEFVINVTGDPRQSSSTMATMGKEDIELIGEDIRFIQTKGIDWQKKGNSFLGSWVFILLFAAPFILFALLLYDRKRKAQIREDIAGTRSRKATKIAKKRLAQANEYLKKRDEKGFYNEVTRAIWGYLGDKFNMGQSELSRETIKDKLSAQEVPETLIDQVTEVLDQSEMALFAPSSNGTSMNESYQRAEKLISDLENHMN